MAKRVTHLAERLTKIYIYWKEKYECKVIGTQLPFGIHDSFLTNCKQTLLSISLQPCLIHFYSLPSLSLLFWSSSAWIFWYLTWSSADEWSECLHLIAILPQAARLRLARTEEFLMFMCEFVVVNRVLRN